jgi:hypothetical protein
MSQIESSAKFTPGPWVQFHDQGKPHAIMPAMRPGDVCKFAEPYPSLADAQLMSAAPKLLKMVQLFAKSVEYEIRKDKDEEGRRMKTLTLNLIRETIKLASPS